MAYTEIAFDPTTMKGQDFTTAKSIDKTIFSNVFGDPSQFWVTGTKDGLMITSSQAAGWPQAGIMQVDADPSGGFGYGRYVWRFRSGQAGQGPGTNLIMWPSNGVWFPQSIKGQATEIDVEEDWSMKGAPTATVHYDSSAVTATVYTNGQEMHGIKFAAGQDDTSQQHLYEFDWLPDHIELWVDGVSQFRDTGAIVPKSFADGGMNRTLGAQVVIQSTIEPLPTMQMYLGACYYVPQSVLEAASSGTTPVPTTPVATGSGSSSGSSSSSSGGTSGGTSVGSSGSSGGTTTPVTPPPSDAVFTVQATVTAVGVTYHVVKKTGAANTLRYFLDGKFVGALRDGFPDCTKDLVEPLPPVGAHVAGFTLDGSDLSAAVSFTVAPPTSTGPVVVPPVAPIATNSDIITALATASASQLAAVRKDLGL